MKNLLMTTAALFVVGGMTAAFADVSISGNVKFRYHTWSDDAVDAAGSGNNNNEMADDLEIWIKSDMTADSGLTYGTATRLRKEGNVDRNYIHLSDDWGKLVLGRDWSPMINMSLGANWRGAISGGQYVGGLGSNGKVMTSSWNTTSGNGLKLAYYTPDLSGLKAGISMADAGSASKANSTGAAITYAFDVGDDMGVRLGYNFENKSADSKSLNVTDNKISQLGIELTSGDFLVSVVRIGDKKVVNDNAEMTHADNNSKQTGTELQVTYDVSDDLKLSYIRFSAKESAGGNSGDKFSSNELGAKYTIAPGLLLSVSHNMHKFADANSTTKGAGGDNAGTSTRAELRINF